MIAATGKNASDSEIDAMFKEGDIDGDGRMDLVEFIKLMFPAATATLSKLQKSFKSINDIKATFRKWDSDGDGHISRLELRLQTLSESEVNTGFALSESQRADVERAKGRQYCNITIL